MALPKNNLPVYTLTVPSTNKSLKYRPFVVKDEKALLIAQQSKDEQVMLDTLKLIIQSCSISDVDVDTLATFDVEYIFTQLRAVSVGEIVTLVFRCDTCEDPNAKAPVDIDLQKLKVFVPENHSTKISLFDDVGIKMKYPTLSTIAKLGEDISLDVIMDCVDFIYDSDEVYKPQDQTREELENFFNNLTSDQYEKVENFFVTMPSLRYDFSYTCPVCNKKHDRFLEGLSSFF